MVNHPIARNCLVALILGLLLASLIACADRRARPGDSKAAAPLSALPEATPEATRRGQWLGQKLPLEGPAIFAPGFISLPGSGEYAARFSSNLEEFFFTRTGDPQSIYETREQNGVWSKPELIVSSAHEACISPDGNTLYFGWFHPLPPGATKTLGEDYGIWAKDRVGGGWGDPRYVGQGMYLSLTPDGDLYLTAYDSAQRGYLASVKVVNGRFDSALPLGGGLGDLRGSYDNIAHPAIAPDRSFILFDVGGGRASLRGIPRRRRGLGKADRLDRARHRSLGGHSLRFP